MIQLLTRIPLARFAHQPKRNGWSSPANRRYDGAGEGRLWTFKALDNTVLYYRWWLKVIAFLVQVNGERVCLAGVGDDGVMGVAADWVGGLALDGTPKPMRLGLTVGGLDSVTREHLHWKTPKLQVGDTITIQIVEADSVDPEFRRYRGEASPGAE